MLIPGLVTDHILTFLLPPSLPVCLSVWRRSWSGDKFTNKEWVSQHGDGKAHVK
jgi:UPF0716 family protein affecting phage T7 exclusion